MKVVLTREARGDLRAIALYMARDNPARAITFIADLQAVAQRLADAPRGFPLVPRYEQYGIRRRSWRGYGLLYAARDDAIVVFRVLGPGQYHDRILQLR